MYVSRTSNPTCDCQPHELNVRLLTHLQAMQGHVKGMPMLVGVGCLASLTEPLGHVTPIKESTND